LRARYYDPSLGRFINVDPWTGRFRNPASLNRYAYVLDNPLRFTDCSGLTPAPTDGPPGDRYIPGVTTKATDLRVRQDFPFIGGCKAEQVGMGFGQLFVGGFLEVGVALAEWFSLGVATPVLGAVVIAGGYDIYEGVKNVVEACQRPTFP
jgi:hypothetical protein